LSVLAELHPARITSNRTAVVTVVRVRFLGVRGHGGLSTPNSELIFTIPPRGFSSWSGSPARPVDTISA